MTLRHIVLYILFSQLPLELSAGTLDVDTATSFEFRHALVDVFVTAAQTFEIGTSGRLSRIEIKAWRNQSYGSSDLRIDIRPVINGLPGDDTTTIASAVLPLIDVPTGSPILEPIPLTSVLFPNGGATVASGERFSFVFSLTNKQLNSPPNSFNIQLTQGNSYPYGEYFGRGPGTQNMWHSPGYEIQLRTFITVPEPSSTMLAACLFLQCLGVTLRF